MEAELRKKPGCFIARRLIATRHIDRIDGKTSVGGVPYPSWIQEKAIRDADGGASISAHAAKGLSRRQGRNSTSASAPVFYLRAHHYTQ